MKIDESTGEIIPENKMLLMDKSPAIIIDVSEVDKYHNEPSKLVEKINEQAGYMVFDVKTSKGRDACRSHAAQIIKCIAPACNESKRLASEAKKIVNQDVSFRKYFEAGVREIAEYHRKPLTEWEAEQARIVEQERIFAEKMEAMQLYQSDWDDAIAFDELFDLRKEKELREAELAALKKLQEQEEYDRQLQEQAVQLEREKQMELENQVEIERQEKIKLSEQIEQMKVDQQKFIDDLKSSSAQVKEYGSFIAASITHDVCENKVTISEKEYESLLADSKILARIVSIWGQSEMIESKEYTEKLNYLMSFMTKFNLIPS